MNFVPNAAMLKGLVAVMTICLVVVSGCSGPVGYDVLIRNARIIDGTGNPWYRASLGIKAGRIVAIGELPNASATKVIDANGRVLAPGFIDVHTHIETRPTGGIETVPLRHRFRYQSKFALRNSPR